MISILGPKVFLSVPKNNGMIHTFKVGGVGRISFPDIDISDPMKGNYLCLIYMYTKW